MSNSILCHLARIRLYVLVLALVGGCSGDTTDTTTHDPDVRVLSAREHLEEAWDTALDWRDDAELKEIRCGVIGPAQVMPPYIDFTFESTGEEHLKFYVSCSASSCTGREMRVSVTSGWGAVEFDDEMIDSPEAAIIGLRSGGAQFAYGKSATMLISLVRASPRDVGPVVWEAYYVDLGDPLYVLIDPYTGEIIRTE